MNDRYARGDRAPDADVGVELADMMRALELQTLGILLADGISLDALLDEWACLLTRRHLGGRVRES